MKHKSERRHPSGQERGQGQDASPSASASVLVRERIRRRVGGAEKAGWGHWWDRMERRLDWQEETEMRLGHIQKGSQGSRLGRDTQGRANRAVCEQDRRICFSKSCGVALFLVVDSVTVSGGMPQPASAASPRRPAGPWSRWQRLGAMAARCALAHRSLGRPSVASRRWGSELALPRATTAARSESPRSRSRCRPGAWRS